MSLDSRFSGEARSSSARCGNDKSDVLVSLAIAYRSRTAWYTNAMLKHWSTDEEKFKKEHPEKYRLWKLAFKINYGLDGEKLDREEVKHAWPKIKDEIDPYKRRLIEFLLWGKRYSLPNNISFWTWSHEMID